MFLFSRTSAKLLLGLSLPFALSSAAVSNGVDDPNQQGPNPRAQAAAPNPSIATDAGITVSGPYNVSVWADQSTFTPIGKLFNAPRAITFDDSNGAYVAARGVIYYLEDRKSGCEPGQQPLCNLDVPDGKADLLPIIALDDINSNVGRGAISGLTYHAQRLYVSRGVDKLTGPPTFGANEVLMFIDRDGDGIVDDFDNDGIWESEDIIVSTGETSTHTISAVVPTPDGTELLISKGSYGNIGLNEAGTDPCANPLECTATILACDLEGGNLRVFAEGLRNTVEPQFGKNGELFGVDNAANGPILSPPEEVNHIVEGNNYGFPFATSGNPQPPEAVPIGAVQTHQAPVGTAAYSYPELIQFPGLRDEILVSLYGAFNPNLKNPYGQSVVRLNIRETSRGKFRSIPDVTPDIMTGVSNAFAFGFEHPVDVATNGRGDIFVVDLQDDGYPPFDNTGKIYRVTFRDLDVRTEQIVIGEPFQVDLRGGPLAYYIMFIQVDPDPNFSMEFGPGGRNGTSTMSLPVQVKSGLMGKDGKRSFTVRVPAPAPELVGHDLRFELFRIDFDPVTQSYLPNDFFIGESTTCTIVAR